MHFEYPIGATPLDLDESEQLIPDHITLQTELNEWEFSNIFEADAWLFKNSRRVIDMDFLTLLHKRMFCKTWRWAGKFRKSNKNTGIDWPYILEHTRNLMDDLQYQLIHPIETCVEISIKFHHRLVSIHPFPNGNGRHARLIADYILYQQEKRRFGWGKSNLGENNEVRRIYIRALREADNGNILPLLEFAQS